MPIVACLPYTLIGGLRATFLAHYFNTAFIFFALFVFMFVGYVGGGDGSYYGSPGLVLESPWLRGPTTRKSPRPTRHTRKRLTRKCEFACNRFTRNFIFTRK